MNKTFTQRHPWLTKKLKKQYFPMLNKIGIASFTFHLDNSNLKFKINPKDDNVGKFVYFGSYESETRQFASKFIRTGDQVLDIGANIGYFTMLFSSYVGINGEVHSFEPSRREFYHLCENVILNNADNIFLNQLAVDNTSGYTKMNILDEDHFGAYNSISEIVHQKVNSANTHAETVRAIKIDDYLSLFPDLNPSLVKIDVEGFEKQVLEGMRNLLNSPKAPCLILEICISTHRDKNIGATELVKFIEELGYKLFCSDNEGNLRPFRLGATLNGIAIKSSHYQRLLDQGINIAETN